MEVIQQVLGEDEIIQKNEKNKKTISSREKDY
jgi:hypothetical protein